MLRRKMLDSYQLYLRYEETPPKGDWKKAALQGPALPTLGNAVAGAVGAAASNLATYPLSLIIARLQTQKQRKRKLADDKSEEEGEGGEEYTGILDAARKIYAKEGISALYSGVAQDTVKSVLDAFLFFLAYEFFRQRRIVARYGGRRRAKGTVLPVLDELAIGVLAGAFSKLFTMPLSNIVARKQTSGTSASTSDIAAKIRKEKGLGGFWSGYSASLILTLNPSITFFFNEMLKYALRRKQSGKRSALTTFLLAAISKSAASSITYPISMAKTRSQISDAGSKAESESAKVSNGSESEELFLMPSIISNVITIARTEGVSELYAGLRGEVLKGFFSHGFTMLAKDAVYAGIVRAYYLLLILTRRYPSPEELLERARERAEEYAEAAREGAKGLAEKAKTGTDEVLENATGSLTVDTTSKTTPVDVDALKSNETAEMVGDYVEDEARDELLPMATDPQSGPGLGDLEKELTCSICTDLLFQPLTLLDCLHTFCGSCLKEWFYTQGSRRSPSSTRYTCPSCRANVRETRPNATVTTLLDMVLTANPERAKPAAERAEIEQRYKHGESVFPPPSSPDNSSAGSDEEDRRILDEVRQLSLQNPRVPLPVAQRSRQSSRTRQTDSGDTSGDGRSRRRREEERAARRQRTARTTAGESGDARERSRRVEHQSSLRSLLSLSSDTETMEEEILRQIFEEGLLDDIDLDNLEPGQEEELSERIADAYRRRHNLLRSRSQRLQENSAQLQTQRRPHGRSQSTQRPQDTLNSPSNPRSPLLEPPASRPSPSSHQRRLSEQGSNRRRRTSPVPYNPASSSDVTLGPALRSSSDIIPDRPRNSHSRPPPAGTVTTRSRRSNSSGQSIPLVSIGDRHRASSTSRTTRTSIDSPRLASSAARNPLDSPSFLRPRNGVSELSVNSSVVAEVYGPARHEARPRPSSSRSTTQPTSSHPEPSISCDSCGKTNIQYDLHKTCSQCKDGNYHLCLRCYRQGRGCLDWKGFETSAQAAFVRKRALASNSPTQSPESQHTLQSFKYSRPPETALRFMRDGKDMTSDDPARRLQQGLFCDRCHSSANGCLWTCNQCNQGDWGFCNRCINQGKCCTHPLLPISYTGLGSRALQEQRTGDSSAAPFNVLTISTRCDACSCPIPTSTLRFHCLRCNDGDYDLCANCYLRFIAISKIRKEDGLNGWRRCLRGHRMIVVGFEDYPEGQRRAIARNLVGGNALKDKHLPPTSSPVAVSSPAGTPTSGTPSTVGDWSWKEGSERRKKASRIRSAWNNDRDRDRTPGSEPGTPSSLNPGSPQSPATAPSVSRRFPPDGGVGLIVHALWSWYPEEGVHDELLFPRGAEITEAENINDDWYWGCYAGMTGLFPGSHVSVVGEIV
ncbi:SH3 domain protein [Aspergillus undulatus]|uniref:SH3 domain protein n=1 Tax=Aspergillus undulatus TaxID=1810928 RepID=UPI003CCDBF30